MSWSDLCKTTINRHRQSVQRYRFNTHLRKQGESIAAYVAELWRLTEYCNYGDSLRDRLVCGVNDQRVQCRLLAEADLTLKKAYDIAQAMEAAERSARELQGTASESVHRVYGKKKGGGVRRHETCYRCLGNHHPTECKFKESECYHCGKKGHIGRACREKQVSQVQHVEPADTGGTDEYSLFPL